MLQLAHDRSAGSIPYLYNADQTAAARTALGPDRVLAPELAVSLETDPGRARAIGREYFARYHDRPNYTNNLRRQGLVDSDFTDGGSDRLIDAIVAWGGLDAIHTRISELFDAGADHVSLQVLNDDLMANPVDEWRIISALNGSFRPRRP
jgi:probable F420-dependent oxidoreductase